MRVTKINMDDLESLRLHDSFLKEISYSYDEKSARILLDITEAINAEHDQRVCILTLKGIVEFRVTNYEPWGAGHHVADFYWEELEGKIRNQYITEWQSAPNIFMVELLLNSGDKITAYLEEVEISDKN